ncbi:MAG: GGDEF domain-containing protein [Candidatus Coatesbacteria bacterium]|nr:GGDEF domain-containing protein [Candidatus Coatesbacteria bacterium]
MKFKKHLSKFIILLLTIIYLVYLAIWGEIFVFKPLATITSPLILVLFLYVLFKEKSYAEDTVFFAAGLYFIISDILLRSNEDMIHFLPNTIASILFGFLLFKYNRKEIMLLGAISPLLTAGALIHNKFEINIYLMLGNTIFLPITCGFIGYCLNKKFHGQEEDEKDNFDEVNIGKIEKNNASGDPLDVRNFDKEWQLILNSHKSIVGHLLENLYNGLILQTIAYFAVERDHLRLVKYFSSVENHIIPTAIIPSGVGAIGWILKEKKTVLNGQLHTPGNLLKYYTNQAFIESILAVPVFSQNEKQDLVGVIVLDHANPNVFDEQIQSIVERTANVFSMIDEWVSKQLEMVKSNKYLSTIQSMHNIGGNSASLNDFVQKALEYYEEVFKTSDIVIVIGKQEDDKIELRYRRGIFNIFDRQAINSGIVKWILKNRHHYIKTHIDPKITQVFNPQTNIDRFNYKSVIGTYLNSIGDNGEPGVIILTSPNPNNFDISDARFLEILTDTFITFCLYTIRQEDFENKSRKDSLTGLWNHRHFMDEIKKIKKKAILKSKDTNSKFCIIMFDIDEFKKINDTYGHPTGDKVLEGISCLLRSKSKEIVQKDGIRYEKVSFYHDTYRSMYTKDEIGKVIDSTFNPARYGGEEFICILIDADLGKGVVFAEMLRKEIAKLVFSKNKGYEFRITCSFGVACYPDDESEISKLIEKADTLLYEAKKKGKNQVRPSLRN